MNSLIDMYVDAEELRAARTPAQSSVDNVLHKRSLWSGRSLEQLAESIGALQSRVGQLNLMIVAVVRSLVRRGLIKPDELSQLMKEIDLEDGKADGQLAKSSLIRRFDVRSATRKLRRDVRFASSVVFAL